MQQRPSGSAGRAGGDGCLDRARAPTHLPHVHGSPGLGDGGAALRTVPVMSDLHPDDPVVVNPARPRRARQVGRVGAVALVANALMILTIVNVMWQAWDVPLVRSTVAVGELSDPGPGAPLLLHSDGRATACTLGLPWMSDSGVHGWVTAAHCNRDGARVHVQRDGSFVSPLGTLHRHEDFHWDAAFIDPSRAASPPGTDRVHGVQDVRMRNSADVRIGDQVCLSGITTGASCGWRVTDLDAVEPGDTAGRLMRGALAEGRAHTCVSPGDSGGPVWLDSPEGATVVGIVTGTSSTRGLGPLLPSHCLLMFTTLKQITAEIGGHVATAAP